MSKEQDALFFRNFVLILVMLTAFGFVAAFMGKFFATDEKKDVYVSDTMEKQIAPVGEVNTDPNAHHYAAIPAGGAAPPATAAAAPVALTGAALGKHTFDTVCMACHAAGVAGAPKFGDKAAWAPRIAKGLDVLHQHALNGFQGSAGTMPPRGGNPDLSDDAVKAGVDYMVANSGGPAMAESASAPAPAPAATPAPAAPPAAAATEPAPAPPAAETTTPAAPAAAAAAPATTADTGATGKHIFDTVCFVCHANGVAGAPKFGDKAAWAPRIAKGLDVLHQHALAGFMGESGGMMPPKGGRTDLSDDDVKAAVDYMVNAAK